MCCVGVGLVCMGFVYGYGSGDIVFVFLIVYMIVYDVLMIVLLVFVVDVVFDLLFMVVVESVEYVIVDVLL